jgi:hypothetical protein
MDEYVHFNHQFVETTKQVGSLFCSRSGRKNIQPLRNSLKFFAAADIRVESATIAIISATWGFITKRPQRKLNIGE